MSRLVYRSLCFFFNDTSTTEIYTLSLHDALPIFLPALPVKLSENFWPFLINVPRGDRKSTRLNSSHRCISYAVFCLKKKNARTRRRTDGSPAVTQLKLKDTHTSFEST